jgi:signal transduction histidine kinase
VDPDPPITDALSVAQAHRDATARWLLLLVPLILLVVVWATATASPAPTVGGRGLAVALALVGFVAGSLGVLVTLRRPGGVHLSVVVIVFATSAGLIWLQPGGAGVAGIFVGVSLLAPRLRGHPSIPLAVVALITLGVVVASTRHASVAAALLDAIMVGAFYGTLFLAVRLSVANRRAEHLVAELERSRAEQARAAGLAERQRLAREMHDVLAHSLSGLMLHLEAARMLAVERPDDPRLPDIVSRAHHLGRTGLTEARQAIGMLRDDELPGPDRLMALATEFRRDWDIPCIVDVRGDHYPLSDEARLAVYRVAQEALTNIARHAHADRVELHLDYGASTTRLSVEDFGNQGPADPEGGAGYGLTGMRERATLLGGTLTAGSTPTGFRVTLEVPR